MTKDRRLGRGLAALLGTPLEEDGVLESGGTLVAEPTSAAAAGKTPAQRPSNVSAAGDSSPRNSDSPQRSSSLPTNRVAPTVTSAGTSSSTSRGVGSASANASSQGTSNSDGSKANPRATPLKIHAPDSDSSGGTTNERTSKRSGSPAGASHTSSDFADDSSATVTSLEIDVSEIENNPFQPRRRFNETEIAALAESIREHQQLQPILVRRVGDRYQLISGERRLRATIHAGLTKIRAEVREADDRLVAELAIVENLQRKDLDAIEKAMSFRRYIDEHKCAQEDLAKRLKIDRSTIANLMRLLELPAELQAHVQNGKLSSGHARTLLPLGHEEEQLEFARQIMEDGWTVRETERRVAAHLLEQDGQNKPRPNASRSGPRKRDTPHLAALEQEMRLALGTKVELRQQKTGRGKIVINFNNPEEFERLYALICPQVAKRAA